MKMSALPIVLFALFGSLAMAQQYSSLWGENGELWDPETSILRDFSDVGYMNGDFAIPDWPVGVNVTNFGAIPDDDIDDSQAFIDAIAACPDNHAVFVPNGKYIITDQIKPERDYFVLRGEDMYETILYFPKNIKERYPAPDFNVISAFFVVEGGTHRSIESLTFEFREQTKMGHWEHRYPNAIRFGGDVRDSWARNLYIKNADNALTFSDAENISVLNIIFDHYIGRHFFINTAGLTRWVGHIGIGMGGAQKCLCKFDGTQSGGRTHTPEGTRF